MLVPYLVAFPDLNFGEDQEAPEWIKAVRSTLKDETAGDTTADLFDVDDDGGESAAAAASAAVLAENVQEPKPQMDLGEEDDVDGVLDFDAKVSKAGKKVMSSRTVEDLEDDMFNGADVDLSSKKVKAKKEDHEEENYVAGSIAFDDGKKKKKVKKTNREKLLAIYEEHNMSQVHLVDSILTKFRGKEEKMFAMLKTKYNLPDEVESEDEEEEEENPEPIVATDYRRRIVRMYRAACPEKLNTVDKTLTMFSGKETKLFEMLAKKYPAHAELAAEPVLSHRDKFYLFLKEHDPAKLGSVDATMLTFKGKEDKLFDMLYKRYNVAPPVEEEEEVLPPTREEYRERLVAFFTERAPEKLDTVDWTLDKFAGKEEKLFEMLDKKYPSEETKRAKEAETKRIKEEAEEAVRAAKQAAIDEEERRKRVEAQRKQQKIADSAFRERLLEFFKKHDRSKISEVEDIVVKNRMNDHDEVMENLEKEYVNKKPSSKKAFNMAGDDDMFFGSHQPQEVKRSVLIEQERLKRLAAERAAGQKKKTPVAAKKAIPKTDLFSSSGNSNGDDLMDFFN